MRTLRTSAMGRFLLRMACGALIAIVSISAAHAELTETEISDLFSQGKELFREANEASATDPQAARENYQKAALRFERIVRDGGVRNGKLFYNIGNAYFRMNDFGRAILNYRKAEALIPNDPNLKQNLDYARKRRIDRVEQTQKTRAMRAVFFWHYDFSARSRSAIFLISFLLVWGAATARLFFPRPFLRWVIGVSAVLSLLFLASLIAELAQLNSQRPGVVVAREAVARKGDSETYEQSFKEPLHAGAEFILIEDRGDWKHVELADSRRCWLPSKAVGMVR